MPETKLKPGEVKWKDWQVFIDGKPRKLVVEKNRWRFFQEVLADAWNKRVKEG
jgi:hypothetical protein